MKRKNWAKTLILSSIICSIGFIASCGGGGGGGSVSTQATVPQDSQGTYTGAATAGDFARFSVNGTTLYYTVTGPIFGELNGSVEMEPMFGNLDTHFWKSKGGDVKAFFSRNIGLAYVETSDGREAIITGLRKVTDINTIIGKTFVYVDLRNSGIDGCEITINGSSNDTYGNFTYECLSGTSGAGCWKLDISNNRLLATTEPTQDANGNPDCANWDGSNPTEYVVAKPGNNRAGFVVDHTDGSGVGIGLEKKAYSTELDPNKTYTFEILGIYPDEICPGTVTVYFNGTEWVYEWQSDYCNETSNGTLALDNICPGTAYEGVICATNNVSGNQYNVLFDPVDGYYIAVSTDGENIEIGALKE
jgi:hypothetical protein